MAGASARRRVKTFDLFTPENKGIIGELDEEDGTVTFAVEAGPESSIRGTELFNTMMDAFGDAVKAIHGVWIKGAHGGPSVNIDKVNELTAAGVSLQEAVHSTWTVTRAKKRGFTEVIIRGRPEGVPGAYMKVEVWIQKAND